MRSGATALMWLVTTVLVMVAIPAVWVQQHLVDRAGYTALAKRAAADPDLQSATAAELTAQVGRLSPAADSTVVGGIARAYTASPSFPTQFGEANAFAHRWLFTNTVESSLDAQGSWVIDFAPMLADSTFAQTLRDYNVTIPTSVPIPLTDGAPPVLRPGALARIGLWGPWVGWGLAGLAVCSALLTLLAARNRGKALVAFGVSGLLAGGIGWAAIAYAQRYVGQGLDQTSGPTRVIAEAMVTTAQVSMHEWLDVALIAGGGLVVVGVIVSLLSGLVAARG